MFKKFYVSVSLSIINLSNENIRPVTIRLTNFRELQYG